MQMKQITYLKRFLLVRSYDTAQMLLRYLQDFGGSEKIKRLVHSFATVILAEVDSGRIGHELSKPLQHLPSPGLGSFGIEVLTAALQSRHFSRVAEADHFSGRRFFTSSSCAENT